MEKSSGKHRTSFTIQLIAAKYPSEEAEFYGDELWMETFCDLLKTGQECLNSSHLLQQDLLIIWRSKSKNLFPRKDLCAMSRHAVNNHVHYCPFCGQPLAIGLNNIRFCPFCGENLHPLQNPIPVKISAVDADTRSSTIWQEDMSFYSLVVKQCSASRKALVTKLQEIMLRSPRAIHLALESVPCIMMYKEKAEKVLKVLHVFRDEGAAAILFAGDINLQTTIDTAYHDFHKLPANLQMFLRSFPHILWIGENIACVYNVSAQDKGSGMLVVGEYALYFLGRQYDWLVFSYLQIRAIYMMQEALEIELQSGADTEAFHFDDESHIEQAFAHLHKAWEREQRRWQVDTRCEHCDFHVREGLLTVVYHTCPRCSRQLVRKINDTK